MSNLARKSIEPIALQIVGETGVRLLQQFMTRSPLKDDDILEKHQKMLSEAVSSDNGMMSVDSSENVKKGNDCAGAGRQYRGRLGKVENCRPGVFVHIHVKTAMDLLIENCIFKKNCTRNHAVGYYADCQRFFWRLYICG